jgi:hypothetical protein
MRDRRQRLRLVRSLIGCTQTGLRVATRFRKRLRMPEIIVASRVVARERSSERFDQHWGTEDLQKRLNHPTPAVQFLTVLRGTFSISATDGETRQFHAGEVLRLEDTSPCKGHITVVGDQPGFLMFAR